MKFSPSKTIVKLLALFLILSIFVSVQRPLNVTAKEHQQIDGLVYIPAPEIIILADDYNGNFYVPQPQNLKNPNAPTAVTINVDYVGAWTAGAQAAFQAAINVWAGLLTLPSTPPTSIDVQANWVSLAPNVLGSASSNGYWAGGSIPSGIAYPDVLADAIAGVDIRTIVYPSESTNSYEIIANFNSDYANWYTGTDGLTPGTQYDLMTVVLHELGHGLGFAGSASNTSGTGSLSSPPLIYDCFVADGSNTNLLNYTNPSTALGDAFTGNDIHFGGPNAVAASGTGNNAKLYAPATWQSGSSYSHLDDATYDGTSHALMTHALGLGEAVHDPGTITMGILTDIGWNGGAIPPTSGCPSVPTAITLQSMQVDQGVRGVDIILVAGLVAILLIVTRLIRNRKLA